MLTHNCEEKMSEFWDINSVLQGVNSNINRIMKKKVSLELEIVRYQHNPEKKIPI